MSRIIQQIATVQFQVDNRKVTASMNALQTEAESLNGKIAAVKQSIKDLGDVPADNKFLLDYQKQLRQLNSDLKDVTTAQRDLTKGVKAADQLWKAAQTQDIESLSIKAIKAGQNGLRKRMENLHPELGGDEQKMYDAYKAVIDEADRVINVFKSNYATVVQTIRDGGIVSEQAMKSTRDALRDLMEAEKEGTAEHRQLAQQYDFLNESLANVAEMRRREKGEIVNASDARREALKLTEDGIAAARRERDMADAVIAGMQQQKDDLDQLRRFHEDRIAQTEREIAANQELEEAEQDRLADVEKAMRYTENEDRKEAIRLRKKADAARDEAETKKEAYEEQAEQEKLLRQHVKDTGDEVTALTAKIEALGKTEAKPKVDTSEIENLKNLIKEYKAESEKLDTMKTKNASWQRELDEAKAQRDSSLAALGGDASLPINDKHPKMQAALEADIEERKKSLDEFQQKWDTYWDKQEANAKKFAETLGKELKDVSFEDFEKHAKGKMAELAKSWYRTFHRETVGLADFDYAGTMEGSEFQNRIDELKAHRKSEKAKIKDGLESYSFFSDADEVELKILEDLKKRWKEYGDVQNEVHDKNARATEEELKKHKELHQDAERTIRLYTGFVEDGTKEITAQEQKVADLGSKLSEAEGKATAGVREQAEALAQMEKELDDIETKLKQIPTAKRNTEYVTEDYEEKYGKTYDEQYAARNARLEKARHAGKYDEVYAEIEAEEKRYIEALAQRKATETIEANLLKQKEDLLKRINETQQQGTTATNDQTEAIKKQEEELGKLEQKLKRLEESRDGYQNDVKESLKAVKDMGLTEEDLAEDAKVREAVEKKVLEIMEAQAKVGQEIAEQRKKLAGEVKMSDLGGTKADQEFYVKNKDRWDVSNYASPDDMIERIAHLERLKKLKNGKRFNPDEDWEGDDELDEDAPIMSDKEKQAINDELRFLKQHIREELLKTINEVGDIDKAVEQYTGGDGVSEDAKFGEQLNDKISEIKDKIEERIETTLDRYGEMLTEDRDEDAKLTKEQLTSHVSQHMESVKENHGFNRSWLEETQGDIETTKGEIESKKQLIDQMKQQTAATNESTQADQQSADVAKQKVELEGQLKEKTKEHTKAQKDFEAQQEKTNKAQEKAYKAQEESVALNEKAATAEEKVAHQEERHAEAMDQQSERLRQIRAEGQHLLTQYEQQKTEIQAVDKAWADADVKQGEAEARKAQNQELTIKSLDDSIRKLKEANAVIDTNSDEWEENTRIIQRLQAALDEMKNKPALMMMTDRMQDVSKLSTAAVTETRKFWEAMVAGAERGSKELAEYEGHLKTITEEEQKRNRAALEASAKRLNGNLGNLSQDELHQAINDAKLLQSTYKSTSKEAQELAQAIVNAEDHVRRYGVEAERAARKQEEADKKAARAARDKEEADRKAQQEQHTMMQQRAMLERNRTTLSAAALAETKKYWQAVKDGAEEGSVAQRNALRIMEKITAEEQRRNTAANEKKAGILSGTLSNYSEGEIREAIEAGKQLILAYKSGSQEAKDMGKAIAEAEEYIKNVGLDAQRTAVRQEQAITKIREEGAETVERAQNGEFATASMDELDKTIKKLKEYQALIKDPNDTGKKAFEATKEQVDALTEQLNNLKGVAEKVKSSFKDADEVLARFGEHMNAGKTASEGMASALDEKLNHATSSYDTEIEGTIKDVEYYEQQIKEATQELADMEKELAELEAKHKNSSWFRKQTKAYQREAWRIEDLRDEIEGHDVKMDDGSTFRTDYKKQWIEYLQFQKQSAEERVDFYKKKKTEELGITEEVEEKKVDAQRLTQEQMQEGIKLLEEEYRKTDHTTAEGIKRRELLRQTIDQMNQEIKESTGEWMSYAEAEKFAAQAGTEGFIATGQQMQQAQQSLERRRDALIKSIQVRRQEKNMTDEQKKALAAEEAQLDKVNAELKKMKFEMDNTNMSAKRMNEILDNPSAAKNIEELGQAVKRAQAQLKMMEDTVGNTNEEYQEMAQKTKEAAQRQKELEVQFKASASAFDKAWSRLKTYVGLYVGASVAMNKLMGTMGDLMDLSDKMGEVRKTTGFTADEVGRLSGELKKFDTRTTLNGLLDLSVAAGQLGLKTEEDVLGFTEAANKLMVALPEMGREGATEMLKVALATGEIDKIRKQMEQGLIEGSSATAVAMEKVGSTIDRLRATSAATAPAITDFVKRVGAVGAQSGITIDQVAALGSTVDALGMRVEMSATALSRMIPAIKNNAFDVAKAIGVTPETLRMLFETGRGMEAILMIFQHIKDAGMGEDDIESMLGMGNMKEVMKELNQQGARAGIVFAGLSQNVDELRRQLGVANQAYEENIAIQQEYDKMNETTLAKWERLKNTIEEAFVGDFWQRQLGNIIDGIRSITDFITGNVNPVLKTVSTLLWAIVAGLVAVKTNFGEILFLGLGKGLKSIKDTLHYALLVTKDYVVYSWKLATTYNAQERAAIKAAAAQKGLNKAMLANVWTALAVAVGVLIYKIYEWNKAVSETEKELARMSVEEEHARHNLDNLVNSLNKAATSADVAKKKHEDLKGETEALRKEVDTLSKSADKNSEAKSKLSEKTQELEKKEKDLKVAEDESNKANGERLKLINEINSKYSTYLGYMLTEATNAEKVASAHQLIIAALKEEMRQKGIARKQQAIDEKYQKSEEEYSRDSWQELDRLPRATQQRIMDAWTEVRASITSDIDKNGKQTFSLSAIPGLKNSGKTFSSEGELKEYMKQALTEIVGREVPTVSLKGSDARYLNFGTEKKRNLVGFNSFIEDIWGGKTDDGFGDWATATIEKQGEITRELQEDKITKDTDHRKTVSAAVNDINTSFKIISETTTDNQDLTAKQINTLAENVNAIVVDLKKYNGEIKNVDKYVGKDNEVSLENAVNTMFASLTEKQRKQILDAARRASRSGVGGAGGGGSTTPTGGGNVWGSNAPAESTDYGTWDVNELVARRNQMDKFKNVLKPDTDIRAVLAEDKALMKALDNGLKEDWKSVIGWYNTERKKIQEELKSERFSTNTGHWRDEKNGRGRKNRFRESDYALAELDRYYSKRKEDLEKARIEENMSEELFNRQAELLEQEHLERRSKLRETFTAGSTEQEKQMVKQFREWWSQLEKQGLLDEVPWATVESEWSKALASEIGRNNLRVQQDLTKLQEITVKHLNEIAKLIDKERPYDGITANLRKNLTEMDILLADMQKDGPEKDTAKLVKAETVRLKFLLSEAEQAYSLNFEQLKEKMVKEGFGEWAQAIEGDEQLKQSLMQNLRNTYDAIQEAIKKESSVIKKQLEIQWNDLMPGSDMSMKGMFEKAVSDLGLAGDQVKRANSLIGAGTASDRVADKLAIQQMRIQLQMQETYFALMQKIGHERIKQLEQSAVANEREAKALKEKADLLRKEGKTAEAEVAELKAQNALRQSLQDKFDAEHAAKSLSLARTKELAEEEKQRVAIANQLEESQNRLYQELKSWADLLSSSVQSVMEASNAGNAEYYNELAKLELTGKGGPGAGTYVVIENEGTEDATAHYEYLDERQALERQREIEQQNAEAEAWKKVMDDLNNKMSESITDWLNASLQNASIDANTTQLNLNTQAMDKLTDVIGNGLNVNVNTGNMPGNTGNGGDERTSAMKSGTFRINGLDGDMLDKLAQIDDLTLQDKRFRITVDSADTMKKVRELQGVEIPDKTFAVTFDSKDAVKKFQKTNHLKQDGIIGPKTLGKLEQMGVAQTSDKTFQINADDANAVAAFKKYKGITLEEKTIPVKVDGKQAEEDLTRLQNTEIPEKVVTIKFDSKDAVKEFQKMNNLEQVGTIGPKTTAKLKQMGAMQVSDQIFQVNADNQQAIETLSKIQGVTIQNKTFDVIVNDSKTLKQLSAIQGVHIENKTFDVTANTEQAVKDMVAIGATQIADKHVNVIVDTKQGIPDDASAFAYGKQSLAGGIEDIANTEATNANTQALYTVASALSGKAGSEGATGDTGGSGSELSPYAQQQIDESNMVTDTKIANKQKEGQVSTQTDKKIASSNQSTIAKMVAATNLYGAAYQAMSNDNLDMAQKFEMIALQAVGNAAIAGLQVALSSSTAETAANMPVAATKSTAQAGPFAGPILFGILSALVGGLMGLAASKIAKSKSQIAQVTGASVSAGRLSTGMLTYAEGNVNEFTDPKTLTPGRSYNVDGADGKTYRAKYMGKNAKTHITNGPEFHLVGEKGREAILDAHTTQLIRMNDVGIWRDIQTIYNEKSARHVSRRRGRGMSVFADGNLDEFEQVGSETGADASMDFSAIQSSLDRNSAVQEALLERLKEPIYAQNILYGPDGLPNVLRKLSKEAARHGVKYQ